MRKRWLLWGGGAVVVYLVGVGAAIFLSLNHVPDLFSSPTEIRDSPEFESGSVGILKPVRHSVNSDWPADVVWPVPDVIPGAGDGFLLEWRDEPVTAERRQPNRWSGGLEDDDEIELVAFASWMPKADDDVSEGAQWKAVPVFRDAKTLEPLAKKDLDALGIPEAFRSLEPPREYQTGKLRLLFRAKHMEFVRFIGGEGGDTRTGAAVTYELDRLGEAEPMSAQIGEWARMDLALLIWHDTPLRLHLQVLTGQPEIAELEQRTGAQVAFGDCLRVQWLDRVRGEVSVESNTHGFAPAASVSATEKKAIKARIESGVHNHAWIKVMAPNIPESPSLGLLRISSEDYLDHHCGWIRANGEVDWYWDQRGDADQGALALTRNPLESNQPMKLVFLPKVAELTLELAGLPDLPNPRNIEDLFDVRISRLTLPEDPEEAEDHLIGFLSVGAEVEWEYSNLWDERPPAEFPADRTFRNQTPQELLVWYKQVTPGSKIRYDEAAKVLYVNEQRDSWWSTFTEWLSDLRYLL